VLVISADGNFVRTRIRRGVLIKVRRSIASVIYEVSQGAGCVVFMSSAEFFSTVMLNH
jgi:gentisate 1,2-dioxygenase